VLLDTIGELASVYSLAVGGVCGRQPGSGRRHNPLEPAQFGVPIVMGPHYANFRSSEAARVDPDGTAEQFGDEPLLIARETGLPVYVAKQRFLAGMLAEAPVGVSSIDLPAVHLLDDGFQHRQLYRDVDILLLDGHDWLEEGLLPVGNLREPVEAARRATIIAIPSPDDAPEMEAALRAWGFAGPVWRIHRRMQLPSLSGMGTGPVCAFCGIARPEQFFAGLEEAGLHIGARIAFPDHYRYTEAVLKRLVAQAERAGATALMTTERIWFDWAALPRQSRNHYC
jgi:tetraacyldisaccharide 4'-kinase